MVLGALHSALQKIPEIMGLDKCASVPGDRDAVGCSQSKGTHTMTEHARSSDADGSAALGICESLLLALTDLKVITERDARDLLTDVVTSHDEAATTSQSPDRHHACRRHCVQRILAGKDGVRRRSCADRVEPIPWSRND